MYMTITDSINMFLRKCLLAVGLLAGTAAMAQSDGDHNFKVARSLDVFNAIYKDLDMMYVDTLDADEVVRTAIRSMLGSLDPYTEYYPEDAAGDYRQMMTGKYAGIGAVISYNYPIKRTVINEPYEYMPAAEAGLRKGDIILSIDGETMEGKDVSYVSEHLRGDAGTTLELKYLRPMTGKTTTVKIQRRSIQLPYMPYYGMQPGGIGYICLESFLEGCAKDFRNAFIDLRRQGAKGLVIDLRGNGGGSVQEALSILNLFLPKGDTLLCMKGKLQRSNQTYTATLEPVDTVMPIVVLVNEMTASASEITSGALQDYDRAVILGTRTYGKGLVQVPNVELPYNGKLKLTTAKYYIPSGRCVQAINYRHSRGGYTEHVPDSLTRVFHTAAGREVRDGGGVTPDVVLVPDSMPNIAYYLQRADTLSLLLNYETDYINAHPTIAPPSEFALTDEDYEEFKRRVVASGFTYDRVSEKALDELVRMARFEGYYDDAKAEFDALSKKLTHNLEKDLDYPYNKKILLEMLTSDIVSAYYYQRGETECRLRTDEQMAEAVRLLQSPEEYQSLLRPKAEAVSAPPAKGKPAAKRKKK